MLELERLTGVPRSRIKSRRASLGIVRDERMQRDRVWLPIVTPELGQLPDAVIARRAGKHPQLVAAARRELGIPRCPKPSKAIEAMRERLKAMPKAELRRLLAALDSIGAAIVRERIMADRPATLAQIGRRFYLRRQRVQQRERMVVESIGQGGQTPR